MLDDSDSDMLGALFVFGGGGLVIFVLWIVVSIAVANNKDECGAMRCPDGLQPKLMAHDCLCVTKAKKRVLP